MAENEEFGLKDVEYSPIDRDSQGKPKMTRKYGQKQPKKGGNKKTGIIVFIGVLVVVGLALLWFLAIAPANQQKAEEKRLAEEARLEQEARDRAEQARQDSLATIAAEQEAMQNEEVVEEEPPAGTVTRLSEKTGRSYVVVGSFFDEDMAVDASNKLSAAGVSSYILAPVGDVRFFRLAIEDYDSFSEALSAVEGYKGEYGEEVWALKY